MYRIELTPGEVTVFRTIDELATGVRNGLITPKARIYHNASDKWLPIEFHPHYKQALEINAGHAGDAGGHKPAPAGSKPASSKQAPKGGFTFLNVPISSVTPTPKPKRKSRVADLPYIQDGDAPATEAAARSSQGHEPSPAPADDRPSIEHSRAHDAPVDSAATSRAATAEEIPPAHHAMAQPTADLRPADHAPAVHASAPDAPIERSPAYDLGLQSSLEQPPAHQVAQHLPAQPAADHQAPVDVAPARRAPASEVPEHDASGDDAAEHGAPARYSPVEHTPWYEATPARRQPFKPILADETPLYRPPSRRFANDEAEAHAAFEAHLPPEPIRIEDPIHDAPRSRFAVEELFAPPAPREPSVPPISASPVLELPKISYPEITPLEPPVAERSSGGSRARRTLHLAGAVLLLAAGGYASTTVFSFGRDDGGFNAASTMADRPVVPARTTAPAPATAPASPSGRAAAPAGTSSSTPGRAASPSASSPRAGWTPAGGPLAAASAPGAEEGPLPPASSGFAPALEPRAIVNVPLKPAPKPDPVIDSSAIAPAIDMQVSVPDLQVAESLAGSPRQKSDSAMKRILRAVSGKKDAP